MPEYDVLVIGGGAAGLRAAVAAKRAGASVAVLSKVHPLRTNSALSPGGINAPLGSDDSAQKFADDILNAGEGLCDPEAVNALAAEAAREVVWLERVGVPFNRDADGRIDRRALGAGSAARAAYADDRTGHTVLHVLHEQFQRYDIACFKEWFVTSLIQDAGACTGAVALDHRSGRIESFSAGAVVLATGGFIQAYRPCTAAVGTTGDGLALGYDLGVGLADMEMVQFHPTVYSAARTALISEAALSAGARLVNAEGDTVVDAAGLSRARLAAAVDKAGRNGGGPVSLDLRPVENLASRFPGAAEVVRLMAGLDITQAPVPVQAVAHRAMGGLESNASGETSVAGLFAVGECAHSGVHGAGRLPGNTLTEAVVFGKRVGEAAAAHAKSAGTRSASTDQAARDGQRLAEITSGGSSGDTLGTIHRELGEVMHANLGVTRTDAGLAEAQEKIRTLRERHGKLRVGNKSRIFNYALTSHLELGNMLKLAEAVALAARGRNESRGAHLRSDCPERDDTSWKAHTVVREQDGAPKLDRKAVSA